MRALFAGTAVLAMLLGNVALGQDRSVIKPNKNPQPKPIELTAEMRTYMQALQRQDEPMQNARRAAQVKAEQRRARLAAQQWYGISNLRPMANPIPFMGTYSPMWAGNGFTEHYWHAGKVYYSAGLVEQNVYYHR